MEEISSYLFVYGTLLAEKNEFAAHVQKNCNFYQHAKFSGRLYDIGEYPGAIFDTEDNGFVYGSIYVMNTPVQTLKILDDYEGFGEDQLQPNEFIRKLLAVKTKDEPVNCWVYLYNLPVDSYRQIISGDYWG